MDRRLHDLAPLLRCHVCGGAEWRQIVEGGLGCAACGTAHRFDRGVLTIGGSAPDATVEQERAAVVASEHGSGTRSFEDLASATGALRSAILSLPWGDASSHYAAPGYFADVRRSADAFEFVRANLGFVPGARLLDVGADFTWSTAHLARSGFDCTAIDINHHLPLASLFQEAFGVEYRLVNVDAHVPCFRDGVFDVITAFAALHHSHRLETLLGNLGRSLAMGGRLGFVEPFCVTEAERQRFGRDQIDLGINENVYTLDEWHRALSHAGFEQRVIWLSGSFNAVYVKTGTANRADSANGPLAHFYHGSLDVIDSPPDSVAPGAALSIAVRVHNAGNAVWSSGGMTPVCLGYHVGLGTPNQADISTADLPRTDLPRTIPPGASVACAVDVMAPAAPGDYVLRIDLVHERVSWFRDRGFGTALVPVRVQS